MEGFGEEGTFWAIASFPLALMVNHNIFGFPLEVMVIGRFRAGFPLKVARRLWGEGAGGGGVRHFRGRF